MQKRFSASKIGYQCIGQFPRQVELNVGEKALDKTSEVEQTAVRMVGIDHKQLLDIYTAATHRSIAQSPRQPAGKSCYCKHQPTAKIATQKQVRQHRRHQRNADSADIIGPHGAHKSSNQPPVVPNPLAPNASFDKPQGQKRKGQIGSLGHHLMRIVQ